MKKLIYLPILLLTLFVSVNKVNAEVKTVYVDTSFYRYYEDYSNLDTTIVNNLISYYVSNLSSEYNYYRITFMGNNSYSTCDITTNYNCRQYLTLIASHTNLLWYASHGQSNANTGFKYKSTDLVSYYCYDFTDNTYSTNCAGVFYENYLPYTTNTAFHFRNSNYVSTSSSIDVVYLPLYSNLDLGLSLPQYELKNDYVIPTFTSLSTNTYVPNPSDPNSGGNGIHIQDMFTNPIQALESVWTSIVGIFNLIGEFIALIPSPLREFLISAFMLAIILGILKILL